jgi:hypothetical protein
MSDVLVEATQTREHLLVVVAVVLVTVLVDE